MSKRSSVKIAALLSFVGAFCIYAFFNQSSDLNKASNKGINNFVSSSKGQLKIRLPENNEMASMIKSSKVASAENAKDYMADLEHAVNSGDELAIQAAIEAIVGCPGCVERMIEILGDPSYDEKFRKYAAKALVESGTREGIVAVIRGIVDADLQEQHDFKDGLIQVLADVDSIEAADTLAGILLGEDPSYSDFVEMPDDVKYAVTKAIRNMSDTMAVGKLLAQRYKSATMPEVRDWLMNINHTVMNSLLAADAYREGNIEKATKFVERLIEIEDPTAIDSMMLLAQEKTIPVDNIADLMYQWAEKYPDSQNHELLVEYLSNFNSTAEERAVAAYALAAAKDSNKANYALQKAYNYENNPLVKEYIEAALTMVKGKTTK